MQLLTYEDMSVCISLTWSPHMHKNVQLKTRSHTRGRVFFLRRRIYIPLLSYETHVWITYFPITLTEKNVSTQLLNNSLSWPTCLHASSSTKRGGDQSEHSILSRDISPASLKTSDTAQHKCESTGKIDITSPLQIATSYCHVVEKFDTALSPSRTWHRQGGQQHMIIIRHHRSVVRCWPWAGASPPGPQGREEVTNHKILIIKGTKVDLAVRQVGRGECEF